MAFPSSEVGEIRKKLGLDYEEFARLLGVTSRSVRRWEAEGEPQKIPGPAGDVLAALRYGLEKKPDSLLSFVGGALAIGGLAFILISLLDLLFEGSGRGKRR